MSLIEKTFEASGLICMWITTWSRSKSIIRDFNLHCVNWIKFKPEALAQFWMLITDREWETINWAIAWGKLALMRLSANFLACKCFVSFRGKDYLAILKHGIAIRPSSSSKQTFFHRAIRCGVLEKSLFLFNSFFLSRRFVTHSEAYCTVRVRVEMTQELIKPKDVILGNCFFSGKACDELVILMIWQVLMN